MKFKVDENLPVEIATLLREAGHEADTVGDENLLGTKDSNLYEIVKKEKRVLVTLDVGFADIRRYPPDESEGTIVLRLPSQDKSTVVRTFERVIPAFLTEGLVQRLWIVESDRIRIRGGGRLE